MDRDTTSSKTVVVFQGKNLPEVIPGIEKNDTCTVFEINSSDDLLSFLNITGFSTFLPENNDGKKHIDCPHGKPEAPLSPLLKTNTLKQTHKRSPQTIRDMEKQHIKNTLQLCGWQYKCAAQMLGINRTTLYRKMKKYDISCEK